MVDASAAQMAFFLALALVPLVGVAIALVSRWIPLDLSAPIEEILRGVLPAVFLLVVPAITRGLLRLPGLSELSLSAFSLLQSLLIVGVLFGAIVLTYRVVAGPRARFLRLALAALLASLGWIGASKGFSLAVPVLWKATLLYGTLGSVVLFLIWAYVMAWILLLGGFLLVLPDQARPAGPRPAGSPTR